MRIRLTLSTLLLLLAGCAAPGPAGAIDDSPIGQLKSMAWMAGSWVGRSDGTIWEAHYTSPAGGLMLGMTKRYDVKQVVDFFEFESFHIEEDKLVVRPYLKGTRSVAFTLTKLDRAARRAIFENPGHEPRTLDYWRADADTLVIAVTTPIEGEVEEGAPKVQGFRIVLKRG